MSTRSDKVTQSEKKIGKNSEKMPVVDILGVPWNFLGHFKAILRTLRIVRITVLKAMKPKLREPIFSSMQHRPMKYISALLNKWKL